MGRELAASPDTDGEARRVFQAWHAFEACKLTARQLARGNFGKALRTFTALYYRHPFWPLDLVRGLMLRRAVSMIDPDGGRVQGCG